MTITDDTVILDVDNLAISSDPMSYSYYTLTGLDTTRTAASQLMVLTYFTAFSDGTLVSDCTFTNWYDPYLIKQTDSNGNIFLTFNDATGEVTIQNLQTSTVTLANGTVKTRKALSDSTYTKARLLRSQDITNQAHTFQSGTRITSDSLNNAIGQIFDASQELDDRLVKVEGATFEQGITLNSDDFPVIPVLKGGTGATTAGAARTALGADSATNLTTGTIPNARITGLPKGNILAAADDIINKTVGTSANNVVALDGAAKLPAVDGSALTNLPSAPTFGIANTNAVKVDSTSVADDEYARFTANGLESRSTSEVLGDIGAAASSHNHAASEITSGTLGVARGGTGLTSLSTLLNSNTTKSDVGLGSVENTALSTFTGTTNITAVGTISTGVWGGTAIAYADVSGTPTLGTASAAATGDFEASGSITTHNAITTAHGISTFGSTLVDDADAAAARTTLGAAATNHTHVLGNITDAGTAAALDAGITSNDVLQVATSGVTANEFLRLEALGTKVISRTAAETLNDIGAAAAAHTHEDSYAMFITAPADKASPGYVVDARVASARTITNFYAKTESGSCVATLRNITDNVEIASVTANSTGASDASLINTAVTENERIGVVISSNSSAVDLQIVVEYTS